MESSIDPGNGAPKACVELGSEDTRKEARRPRSWVSEAVGLTDALEEVEAFGRTLCTDSVEPALERQDFVLRYFAQRPGVRKSQGVKAIVKTWRVSRGVVHADIRELVAQGELWLGKAGPNTPGQRVYPDRATMERQRLIRMRGRAPR